MTDRRCQGQLYILGSLVRESHSLGGPGIQPHCLSIVNHYPLLCAFSWGDFSFPPQIERTITEHGNSFLQVRVMNQRVHWGFLQNHEWRSFTGKWVIQKLHHPKVHFLVGDDEAVGVLRTIWGQLHREESLLPQKFFDVFCNLGDGPKKYCKFYELSGFSKFHELSEFLEALSFKKDHSSWSLSFPRFCSPSLTSRQRA